MSGALISRYDTIPARRERARELAYVRTQAEVAVAGVAAIGMTTQAALLAATNVALMTRAAADVAPEFTAKFDLIATTAAIGMAQQVQRLSVRL